MKPLFLTHTFMDTPQEQLPQRLPKNAPPLPLKDETREAVRQVFEHDLQPALDRLYDDYIRFIADLRVAEAFVQTAANRRKEQMILETDVGQHDLIQWFLHRGFICDDQALAAIEAGIKSGDIIFDVKENRTMPYMYRKGTPSEERKGIESSREYGMRLLLEKPITPKTT